MNTRASLGFTHLTFALLWLHAAAPLASAQVVTIGGDAEERRREGHLRGDSATSGFLLRSVSSLSPALAGDSGGLRLRVVPPHLLASHNSLVPLSLNDGALWAGRGLSAIVLAGMRAEWGTLRLFLLPELTTQQNTPYPVADLTVFPPEHDLANPLLFTPPVGRSVFASPFHPVQQSIDLPIRFGADAQARLRLGQSSLLAAAGPVIVGVSTENEWWGPGVQNALLLSNHAAGFPHLLVRTLRPIETKVGSFEGRWIVGGLSESDYFDGVADNDLRSLSMLALTWRPRRERGLTIGAARAVYAPANNWGSVVAAFPQVFANVGAPNALPLADTTTLAGRDQLFSLFARWIFPDDGLEVYGEWGRAELPSSLRDLLQYPNHTQAYVLGLRWLGPVLRGGGSVALYGEASYLAQSTTYRYRPIGSWYTSRAVPQGYTNEGQALGAGIGPGSDSQLLGADFVAPTWRGGVFVNRIRALEDVHSQIPYNPVGAHGQCEHDVSLLHGLRGGLRTAAGNMSLTYRAGWRVNTFFENAAPYCPLNVGRNYRNRSISVTFAPSY